MKHVAIIGGGLAGLATAYYLQQQGERLSYTLLEATDRLGGKVVTRKDSGFVIEGGPDSFITQKPWGLQLSRELGLEDELIGCNEARQAVYVVKQDRLQRVPTGYRLVAPTRWRPFLSSPLLSPWGKLRTALDLVVPARTEEGDESLADFVRRRFGQEALETMGGPLMAGIYMADPEQLSLASTFPMFADLERNHGSVIRGLMKARKARAEKPAPPMFMSFRNGMQTLTDRLQQELTGTVLTGQRVERIVREQDYHVLHTAEANYPADAIVFCTPADVSAVLLESYDAELALGLRGIRSVTTAVLSLGFKKADLAGSHALDGFGFVAPKGEAREVLACTWSSTKFPGRAPDDSVLLRAFVGGAANEAAAERSDEELRSCVLKDLGELMGYKAEPTVEWLVRWPKGNPQYDVGHLDRVAGLEERASHLPGVVLAGSSFRGIGLPDCIQSGSVAAKQVLACCD